MGVDVLSDRPASADGDPTDPSAAGGALTSAMRFAMHRLARLALLLVGVAVVAFTMVELSPVDPVDAYVGADTARIGTEQRAAIAERWGLGEPAPVRFGRWLSQMARGDLGTSMIYNAPVSSVIGARFATSLGLMSVAWVLSGVLGFALGVVAAVRSGSLVDRGIRWLAYTIASAPTFWVGLLLLTVFAVQLGWAPVCCAVPIGADPTTVALGQRLAHLALPALTLSLVGVAPIALHTREQALELLRGEVALYGRAQGERTAGLVRYRVLRNVAVPALMLQFASLSELFGGSVLAEQVFSYPGLGQATVAAGLRGDVPLLLGIALFSAVFVYVGNLLGDIAQRAVDPRVSLDPRRLPVRAAG